MTELDLHGYNFHDAREAVLKFVDTLYFEGEGSGRIIHGHGVISENLSEWLNEYPHVRSIEQDSLNTGSTIVHMDL